MYVPCPVHLDIAREDFKEGFIWARVCSNCLVVDGEN